MISSTLFATTYRSYVFRLNMCFYRNRNLFRFTLHRIAIIVSSSIIRNFFTSFVRCDIRLTFSLCHNLMTRSFSLYHNRSMSIYCLHFLFYVEASRFSAAKHFFVTSFLIFPISAQSYFSDITLLFNCCRICVMRSVFIINRNQFHLLKYFSTLCGRSQNILHHQ